jgi:hypothetical protein
MLLEAIPANAVRIEMIISTRKEDTKMFKAPEMEIIRFVAEDIITTSGGIEGDDQFGGAEWE